MRFSGTFKGRHRSGAARAEAPLRQVATPRNWLRGRCIQQPVQPNKEIPLSAPTGQGRRRSTGQGRRRSTGQGRRRSTGQGRRRSTGQGGRRRTAPYARSAPGKPISPKELFHGSPWQKSHAARRRAMLFCRVRCIRSAQHAIRLRTETHGDCGERFGSARKRAARRRSRPRRDLGSRTPTSPSRRTTLRAPTGATSTLLRRWPGSRRRPSAYASARRHWSCRTARRCRRLQWFPHAPRVLHVRGAAVQGLARGAAAVREFTWMALSARIAQRR